MTSFRSLTSLVICVAVLVYGGRPLYYYDGDTSPGIVLCQDVDEYGGTWLVLRGNGKLVR